MSVQKISGFVVVLIIYVLFAVPSEAQQTAKQMAAGKLVEIKIPTPSLKGNILSDVTEREVSVYLPPGYDAAPTKRYPVIYLLHGFGGTNKIWTADAGFNFPPILDALINGGKAREMIVVAPTANNRFGGSFYLNSPVTGNWEDYIFRDVVAYVDANYRTLARASSRGIAGNSMGGFGAVSLGMKHPDVFSAIYALSPCCMGMEGEFLEPHPAWTRVLRITKEEFHKLPPTPDNVYTFIFVGLSAAFAPNPENKLFYSDFLYREEDGKLLRNEAVAARWKAKMLIYLVDEYKSNLLALRGIFLDYGQNEQFTHIRIATSLFSKALAERGIPHSFEIYAGGDHRNKVKERLETRVFAFFSEKLDFSEK